MRVDRKLRSKDIALVICFTALYAVFASIPIFQILGMSSRSITAAAMMTPIIGILLGPYIGTLSAALGGAISFFAGSFFLPSFVSGVVSTLCSGLMHKGQRFWCASVYLSLLLIFGFYPSIGPAWLFPLLMWFQILGFSVLFLPVKTWIDQSVKREKGVRRVLAFFAISLFSTLAGQIAGSLTYVFSVSVLLFSPVPSGGWTLLWQGLTFVYPVERTIIALGSTLIVVPLYKVLRSADLVKLAGSSDSQEKSP